MKVRGSEEFQQRCVDRLKEVLEVHGYGHSSFERIGHGEPSFTANFEHQGKVHTLEVYEDGPVMLQGEQLFEVYMPEEFKSEGALLAGFATRLDRYLSGGPWEGPDEAGWLDAFLRHLGRLFRR